jgi:hypothetical protein
MAVFQTLTPIAFQQNNRVFTKPGKNVKPSEETTHGYFRFHTVNYTNMEAVRIFMVAATQTPSNSVF